jgi:hypothetical protein
LAIFFLPIRQAKRGRGRFPESYVYSFMNPSVILISFLDLAKSLPIKPRGS